MAIRLECAHHRVASVNTIIEMDAGRCTEAILAAGPCFRKYGIELTDHDRVANPDHHDAAKAHALRAFELDAIHRIGNETTARDFDAAVIELRKGGIRQIVNAARTRLQTRVAALV